MGAKYTAYKTPRHLPRCVKYWDKVFKEKSYFHHWRVMHAVVESTIDEVVDDLELPKRKARSVVWNAYCAAVQGDKESPFFDHLQDLIEVINEKEMPLFIAHSSIGCDIHLGMTELEAREAIVEWLNEDPENGIFGAYRLTSQLTVIRI